MKYSSSKSSLSASKQVQPHPVSTWYVTFWKLQIEKTHFISLSEPYHKHNYTELWCISNGHTNQQSHWEDHVEIIQSLVQDPPFNSCTFVASWKHLVNTWSYHNRWKDAVLGGSHQLVVKDKKPSHLNTYVWPKNLHKLSNVKLSCALQIFNNLLNLQNGSTDRIWKSPVRLNFPITVTAWKFQVVSRKVCLTLAEKKNTGMLNLADKKEKICPTEESASEMSKTSHKGKIKIVPLPNSGNRCQKAEQYIHHMPVKQNG